MSSLKAASQNLDAPRTDARSVACQTKVTSWNEWDPLRHVIVGRADHGQIPAPEPAVNAKVPEDSDMRGHWGRRPQHSIDRANELLDGFAALLPSPSTTAPPSRRPTSRPPTSSHVWRHATCC
jgi:glycine amidinotransferase